MLLSLFLALSVAAGPVWASPGGLLVNDQWRLSTDFPGFSLDLDALRLVEFEDNSRVWLTELEKIHAKAQGLKFFDVTDTPDLAPPLKPLMQGPEYPKPNGTKIVKPVLKTLSTNGPKANLAHFTSFRTRYYRSDTGKQSQQWLLSKLADTTSEYAPPSLRELITITEFPHTWGQNSIIVRINGSNPTLGVVIVGAHQDSTNLWPFLPAPGADDDGSGSVTILEAYRALIAANYRPQQDVEFHWYSAEEGGLLGSQAIAQDYLARKVPVRSMIQFDMTAWVKKGTEERVGIITDFVDPALTAFVTQLVDKYLDIPYVETKCGYACSDHASWGKAGYPSAFAIESSFEDSNKNIHSDKDRIDISPEFSFDHMLQFSKLGASYVIEAAGWEKA